MAQHSTIERYPQRADAHTIATAAISAVTPRTVLQQLCTVDGNTLTITTNPATPPSIASDTNHTNGAVQYTDGALRINIECFDDIVLCSIGKAGYSMASELLELLPPHAITDGIVITKQAPQSSIGNLAVIKAGHPIPTAASIEAGKMLHALAERATDRSLIINCISGGGSALVEHLVATTEPPVLLQDLQALTDRLLSADIAINHINTVRKKCSLLKGGHYIETCYPATTVNLVLSDVVGDDVGAIASGLVAPDTTTYRDARGILLQHGVWDEIPLSIKRVIEHGIETESQHNTQLHPDHRFARNYTVVIANNRSALEVASHTATAIGWNTSVHDAPLVGTVQHAAHTIATTVKHHIENSTSDAPHCLLFGGETTVVLHGNGQGGRNQELALYFVQQLDYGMLAAYDIPITLLSVATDGDDGTTDAAGAYADTTLLQQINAQQMSVAHYLKHNDSFALHTACGSIYHTGYTGTNVCDIQIVFIGERGA